jgi:hypothetical protein
VSDALPPEVHAEDHRLQAEIETLRERCRDTQELYREVCVLLFFRHGITPTANKLYQLVRKGSMSAPAEALTRFWSTLREKSRVRIEHPDLPEELRDAAGEAVAALWQRAQALAQDSLSALRGEVQAAVMTAKAEAEAALAKAQSAAESLERVRQDLAATDAARQQLEQDLAREQGRRSALERQLGDGALPAPGTAARAGRVVASLRAADGRATHCWTYRRGAASGRSTARSAGYRPRTLGRDQGAEGGRPSSALERRAGRPASHAGRRVAARAWATAATTERGGGRLVRGARRWRRHCALSWGSGWRSSRRVVLSRHRNEAR